MQRQDGWWGSFAARFGISNMAASAASAMESAVYGTSMDSEDEYSGAPAAPVTPAGGLPRLLCVVWLWRGCPVAALGGCLSAWPCRLRHAHTTNQPTIQLHPTPAGYSKVGRRRRSRQRAANYGARNAGGGKVPRERALVPSGAALRPWRRGEATASADE